MKRSAVIPVGITALSNFTSCNRIDKTDTEWYYIKRTFVLFWRCRFEQFFLYML